MLEKSSSPFINQIHLQRLKQLCALYPIQKPCSTDIQTLAQQLACSDRNVAKLVKTLASFGWLTWKPGRGRGNKSKLEIKISFATALLGVLEMHCRKGQLSEASRYAEQFDYSDAFYAQLPKWLSDAQEVLKDQNHLVKLVPYFMPDLHPLKAIRLASRPHIAGLFDTLVSYDKKSDLVTPHLAHHFEFRGDELWLRIRTDVYFHNGEKLSPSHVVQCLRALIEQHHPNRILYRHVQSVRSEGLWIIIKMAFAHPMILRMLADTHASIYLEQNDNAIPIGTGLFQLGTDSKVHRSELGSDPYISTNNSEQQSLTYHQNTHWFLVKNPRYFGVGALIDKIEFWTIHTASENIYAHITHHGYSQTVPSASVNKKLSMGCETMQFVYKEDILPMNEKTWLIHHAREYCHQHATEQTPVANCVSGRHQNKDIHLYHRTMNKPHRTVRVWGADFNKAHCQDLVNHWRQQGADIEQLSYEDRDSADVEIGWHAAQDDYSLNYYKWVLCSHTFNTCLSPEQQTTLVSIVDQLLQTNSDLNEFTDQLHDCEEWLIKQGVFVPLWRYSSVYNISDTIQGTETDSMGLMSLKKLWLNNQPDL